MDNEEDFEEIEEGIELTKKDLQSFNGKCNSYSNNRNHSMGVENTENITNPNIESEIPQQKISKQTGNLSETNDNKSLLKSPNIQNKKINKDKLEKQQKNEPKVNNINNQDSSTKKLMKTAGRGAAATNGGSLGKDEKLLKNKAVDKGLEGASKIADKNPAIKKTAKELDKSGALNAANSAMNAVGNLKKGNIIKAGKETINSAKNAFKMQKYIIKKFAVMIGIPIILGLFLIFFVIELILGPLMEVWGHIDEAITKTADFSEKVTNFYNGFGFQNTKEAFYEELNELYDKYDSNLDIPLLLSTLFYTEGMGYDTEFGVTEAAGVIDGSVSGSNSGILSAIREYLREKFDEAQQTVDENGLVYNVGKIYRLRKLARNQFYTNTFGLTERRGTEKTVLLSEFLEMYKNNIATDIKDLLTDMVGLAFSSITALFNELCALILGSEYSGAFFDNLGQIAQDFKDTFRQLISDIFYGLADITDIDLSLVGKDGIFTVKITYRQFTFDEENYNNYLMDYYLDNMPEFDKLLPDEESARKAKKEHIITEIYENRDLFKDIFLQYVESDSEVYTNNCVGAIDINLVPSLGLPVNIKSGTSVSFVDGATAFGIRGGVNHNGVDLNSSTAGVSDGDLVYAIADGEVVSSLPNVSCNTRQDENCAYTQGAWVRIKHNIVVKNKEYNFYSVYMHLKTNSGQPQVGTKVKKGDVIGKIGNTGDSSASHLHFEFRDDDGTANGKAIDPTNLFIPCSSEGGFLIHETTLSREMFVSDLRNYCNNNSCSASLKNIFVANAGFIYDVSLKNNVNPELIVVRAMAEGFKPGGSWHNYWGIGCTNTGGLKDCVSYSSLENGIAGFANLRIVKNNETAIDLMSEYAHIGDYWYNPGGPGLGGCYYLPYISQYLPADRVVTATNACVSGKYCPKGGGPNCVSTTNEDQTAYSKWQVADQMGRFRYQIFGLEN